MPDPSTLYDPERDNLDNLDAIAAELDEIDALADELRELDDAGDEVAGRFSDACQEAAERAELVAASFRAMLAGEIDPGPIVAGDDDDDDDDG